MTMDEKRSFQQLLARAEKNLLAKP